MVSEASLGRNLSGAFRSHLFLQWGSSSVSDLVRGEDVGGWKNEALEDQSPIEHGRLTNPSHVLFFLPGRAIVPCVNPASKTQSRHFACNREDLRHKEQKGCRVREVWARDADGSKPMLYQYVSSWGGWISLFIQHCTLHTRVSYLDHFGFIADTQGARKQCR